MKSAARAGDRPGHDRPETASSPEARLPARPSGVAFADSGSLLVGLASDPAEAEADLLAERAMAGLELLRPQGRPSFIRRMCAECEEETHKVRRDAQPGVDAHGGRPAPAAVSSLLAAPGQRLDLATRSFFEQRFKRSFSDVTVHDGTSADHAARSIGARAFTAGSHIAFATGHYAPRTPQGMHLLAHELAHIVQSGPPVIRRARCGHDGLPPRCGGGGVLARWILTDVISGEVEKIALDEKIVRDGLRREFSGFWVTQVQTPPNPVKSGRDRGRMDGVRISGFGNLKLEVVEIKSRAVGCERATREAQGYVDVLMPLRNAFIDISAKLAPIGGVRVVGGWRPNAAQSLLMRQANVDLRNDATKAGWKFYNGLQNRLNQTFATSFSDFQVDLFREGTIGEVYKAGQPVRMDCRLGRGRNSRRGTKGRQLEFMVNREGGVSYGCRDTPCRDEDEERQRQAQEQAQAAARPQAQPQGQPRAQGQDQPQAQAQGQGAQRTTAGGGSGEEGQVNGQGPPQDHPEEEDSSTLPILVGFGTGAAALTAARLAWAQRQATRIASQGLEQLVEARAEQAVVQQAERAAANNVVSLAERRAAVAAEQAAARGAAAGQAARAVASAAAIITILLVASGEAEASIGFGSDPFSALFDVMKRHGHQPSPEMRDLIENDPTLRELAQRAASGGDMTAAQEAATRRIMELIRDNPGAFTAEELEILRQASNGLRGSVTPQTREELRAAIDAAVARHGQPPPASTGHSGPGGGGDSGAGAPASGVPVPNRVSSGDLEEEVRRTRQQYPGLSPALQGRLAAAPPAVRDVFAAMTGAGPGATIDDAVVGEFLDSVPVDLTPAERDTLIANLRAANGADSATILQNLRAAIASARAGQPLGQGGGSGGQAPAAPSPPGAGQPATPTGQVPPQATGTGPAQPSSQAPPPDLDERVRQTLRSAIDSFADWDSVPVNGGGKVHGELANAPAGTDVDLYFYTRVQRGDRPVVRFVAYLLVRVNRAASRPGQVFRGTVVSSTFALGDNGRTLPGIPVGQPIQATIEPPRSGP